ncbi:MHS family MFS transporter [Amycolatopsis acidicola]|uniref:Putative proline/betaine transporter n=1 Tax=Amycolatopsis acidicola TaxID=2596893 RepID=A0A5N0VBZ1_9PSEU|nr:MFS transporter [Amycolatopsis acidicola]KAA9162650.1 MHS family MFS transporter [Amycolatopsis acidicola]
MATQAPAPSVSIGKIAFASFIGTVIEFFDFFIFGTASALIFNKIFFPALDPLAGTLASFATFGVAFAARPLGGVLFGHWGDRLGRKKMLVLSLVLMGVGTAMVGVLPTYGQIGIGAPLLLVLSRLLQGVAIGGEWSGAVLMAVEHAPPGKRAFYGSWPQCGVPAGLVLATALFYLVEQLPADAMRTWGWRLPFLVSVVLVALGLYIRLRISESPAFASVQDKGEQAKFPAGEVIRKSWKAILIAIFSMAAANIPFYLATVFALSYGSQQPGVTRGTVLLAVCVASLIQIFTIPAAAMLADKYGRRPVLLVGCVLTVLEGFPFFWLIDTGSTIAILLAMVIALPIAHTLTYSVLASFVPELFETRLRYSGSAIGYQVGGMIMSGPVPFVAAALYSWAGGAWSLSLYIVLGGVLTFVAVYLARESYRDDIAGLDDAGIARDTTHAT